MFSRIFTEGGLIDIFLIDGVEIERCLVVCALIAANLCQVIYAA